MPAASKLTRGFAFTSVRRFRATQPERPSPTLTDAFNIFGTSTPAAKQHLSESRSGSWRKRAQPDHGMIFTSLDEMSVIVSETPRLVPMDWAISYSA